MISSSHCFFLFLFLCSSKHRLSETRQAMKLCSSTKGFISRELIKSFVRDLAGNKKLIRRRILPYSIRAYKFLAVLSNLSLTWL